MVILASQWEHESCTEHAAQANNASARSVLKPGFKFSVPERNNLVAAQLGNISEDSTWCWQHDDGYLGYAACAARLDVERLSDWRLSAVPHELRPLFWK
jgi:hypothetical protein